LLETRIIGLRRARSSARSARPRASRSTDTSSIALVTLADG
jgi:hypothetical protein